LVALEPDFIDVFCCQSGWYEWVKEEQNALKKDLTLGLTQYEAIQANAKV
jgi:hypothetical protein